MARILWFSVSAIWILSITWALPAEQTGHSDLKVAQSRRHHQWLHPRSSLHDPKGYPPGFWDRPELANSRDRSLRRNSPSYPFEKEEGPLETGDQDVLNRVNNAINNCWFHWLVKRERWKTVKRLPEPALERQDIVEANKCAELYAQRYPALGRRVLRARQSRPSANPSRVPDQGFVDESGRWGDFSMFEQSRSAELGWKNSIQNGLGAVRRALGDFKDQIMPYYFPRRKHTHEASPVPRSRLRFRKVF